MKSYLSLIPISAKVHRRHSRMTLLCIVFAVFLVTAVFSMADMGVRMETARLLDKHGSAALQGMTGNATVQTLYLVAAVLFLLILIAGVLMISSSINSNVAQRTKF
ncbi:MAG: ABC transporter permease, partial [Ruthenibacterium sp.]